MVWRIIRSLPRPKLRGIRSLAGHAETTDVTNDVNGGPSGIGIATAAGKAAFWDFMGAPCSLKVIALEGEFAMTEGHAQELKTQALALQVGKRLRILLSDNNAGIDDTLLGGVIDAKYDSYQIEEQWTSYGWNVFTLKMATITTGRRRPQNHGGLGSPRPPADDRHWQDGQGLLARRRGRERFQGMANS